MGAPAAQADGLRHALPGRGRESQPFMSDTLVIQSHTRPLPFGWLELCLQSVRDWAAVRQYDYRFIGDELLTALDDDLRDRTRMQVVVATDLARLLALRRALDDGYRTVVWCDADTLCFAPQRLVLPDTDFGVGREVWVQYRREGALALRAYVKVHNALMFFRSGNSFLDFYIGAAQRLLRAHAGPYAPQFIGPKFLTAIHNVAACPVVEEAGMLSPLVMRDLERGGGPALELFLARSPAKPAATNLCASLCLSGALDEWLVTLVTQRLLQAGTLG